MGSSSFILDFPAILSSVENLVDLLPPPSLSPSTLLDEPFRADLGTSRFSSSLSTLKRQSNVANDAIEDLLGGGRAGVSRRSRRRFFASTPKQNAEIGESPRPSSICLRNKENSHRSHRVSTNLVRELFPSSYHDDDEIERLQDSFPARSPDALFRPPIAPFFEEWRAGFAQHLVAVDFRRRKLLSFGFAYLRFHARLQRRDDDEAVASLRLVVVARIFRDWRDRSRSRRRERCLIHFALWRRFALERQQRRVTKIVCRRLSLARAFGRWRREARIRAETRMAAFRDELKRKMAAMRRWKEFTARRRNRRRLALIAEAYRRREMTRWAWQGLRLDFTRRTSANFFLARRRLSTCFVAWAEFVFKRQIDRRATIVSFRVGIFFSLWRRRWKAAEVASDANDRRVNKLAARSLRGWSGAVRRSRLARRTASKREAALVGECFAIWRERWSEDRLGRLRWSWEAWRRGMAEEMEAGKSGFLKRVEDAEMRDDIVEANDGDRLGREEEIPSPLNVVRIKTESPLLVYSNPTSLDSFHHLPRVIDRKPLDKDFLLSPIAATNSDGYCSGPFSLTAPRVSTRMESRRLGPGVASEDAEEEAPSLMSTSIEISWSDEGRESGEVDRAGPVNVISGNPFVPYLQQQQREVYSKTALCVWIVTRWRNWPLSIAFEQWRNFVARNKITRVDLQEIVAEFAVRRVRFSFDEWRQRQRRVASAVERSRIVLQHRIFSRLFNFVAKKKRNEEKLESATRERKTRICGVAFDEWRRRWRRRSLHSAAKAKRIKVLENVARIARLWREKSARSRMLSFAEASRREMNRRVVLGIVFDQWRKQAVAPKRHFEGKIARRRFLQWKAFAATRRRLQQGCLEARSRRLKTMFAQWRRRLQDKSIEIEKTKSRAKLIFISWHNLALTERAREVRLTRARQRIIDLGLLAILRRWRETTKRQIVAVDFDAERLECHALEAMKRHAEEARTSRDAFRRWRAWTQRSRRASISRREVESGVERRRLKETFLSWHRRASISTLAVKSRNEEVSRFCLKSWMESSRRRKEIEETKRVADDRCHFSRQRRTFESWGQALALERLVRRRTQAKSETAMRVCFFAWRIDRLEAKALRFHVGNLLRRRFEDWRRSMRRIGVVLVGVAEKVEEERRVVCKMNNFVAWKTKSEKIREFRKSRLKKSMHLCFSSWKKSTLQRLYFSRWRDRVEANKRSRRIRDAIFFSDSSLIKNAFVLWRRVALERKYFVRWKNRATSIKRSRSFSDAISSHVTSLSRRCFASWRSAALVAANVRQQRSRLLIRRSLDSWILWTEDRRRRASLAAEVATIGVLESCWKAWRLQLARDVASRRWSSGEERHALRSAFDGWRMMIASTKERRRLLAQIEMERESERAKNRDSLSLLSRPRVGEKNRDWINPRSKIPRLVASGISSPRNAALLSDRRKPRPPLPDGVASVRVKGLSPYGKMVLDAESSSAEEEGTKEDRFDVEKPKNRISETKRNSLTSDSIPHSLLTDPKSSWSTRPAKSLFIFNKRSSLNSEKNISCSTSDSLKCKKRLIYEDAKSYDCSQFS